MFFATSSEEGLVALAVDDGHQVWTRKDVTPAATLTVLGDLLFVLAQGRQDSGGDRVTGRMDVINQADGRSAWTLDALPDPVVGPVVRGDAVFLATGTDLRAYAAHGGSMSWHVALEARPLALAADGDRLFAALENRSLVSFDAASGASLWRMPLEGDAAALTAAEGRVFVCAKDGTLTAYRGQEAAPPIWQVRRVEAVGVPAAAGGRLFVAQFDNTARAYDAGNGTERWRVRLGSRPRPGVRVAGPQVFVPLLSGAMTACLARDGQSSDQIPLLAPGGAAAPLNRRLEAGGVSADGAWIFRVTRPTSHTAWTLTAVRRK